MNDHLLHSIQKVLLEVNVSSSDLAYHLKDHLEEFLQEQVFPYIESYFGALDLPDDMDAQIDEVTLNLHSEASLDITELKAQIGRQLEKVFITNGSLHSKEPSQALKVLPSGKKKSDTLLHFLEHGRYPWWVLDVNDPEVGVDALLYDCIEDTSFIKSLGKLLKSETTRRRMVLQLSDAFKGLLLPRLARKPELLSFLKKEEFVTLIGELAPPVKQHVWYFLIETALTGEATPLYTSIGNRPELFTQLDPKDTSILEVLGEAINESYGGLIENNESELGDDEIEISFISSEWNDESDPDSEILFVPSDDSSDPAILEDDSEDIISEESPTSSEVQPQQQKAPETEDSSVPKSDSEVIEASEKGELTDEDALDSPVSSPTDASQNSKESNDVESSSTAPADDQKQEKELTEADRNGTREDEHIKNEREQGDARTAMGDKKSNESTPTTSSQSEATKEMDAKSSSGDTEQSNSEIFDLNTGTSYYANNAGLVLLHPFIKPLYSSRRFPNLIVQYPRMMNNQIRKSST